jgi:LacI family transcriptional regulator
MITSHDIARAAGVTQPTVSSVLNGRWRERRICSLTQERVSAAARQLGYRPNRLARGLKLKKTNTIGMVIQTMEHPHQAYINERIVLLLEAQKFEVLVTVVPDLTDVGEIKELYYSHYPEGLIVGPLYAQDRDPFFHQLVRDGFPLIGYDGGRRFPGDQVTHDMLEVIEMGLVHLEQLGHRRMARVAANAGGSESAQWFRDRTNGGESHSRFGTLANGFEFARTLRIGPSQPTAYWLEDPLFAMAFLRGLKTRGIRVPDDVAFVTSSCGTLGRYLETPPTTVYPDLDELAERIVGLTIGRLRGELPRERQCVWLKPRLIVGESTVKCEASPLPEDFGTKNQNQ